MIKTVFGGGHSVAFVVLVALLVLSIALNGVLISRSNDTDRPAGASVSDIKKYNFLSANVIDDNPNDILINFVPLRSKLQEKFKGIDAKQSFYFEYLPDGTSIRIGADQQLTAASLIKVPLVMNLYRAAELGKIDLDTRVTVKASQLDDAYGDLYKRGPGFTLTLREAAEYALRQSDNTATHVIYDHIKNMLSYDEQSMARLDIEQNMEDGQAVITARSYASVLKGLYFSAYLNKNGSQEILKYLTQSDAKNRITRDLPSNVPVAHKIGVYNANWAESDCGIVYVPKRPYVLCVMVGLPEPQANDFIADVSKEVYDFVTSQ